VGAIVFVQYVQTVQPLRSVQVVNRLRPVQMFKVQSFKGGTRSFFLTSAAFYIFHAAQPLAVDLLAADQFQTSKVQLLEGGVSV
jgi:hypothetical protein